MDVGTAIEWLRKCSQIDKTAKNDKVLAVRLSGEGERLILWKMRGNWPLDPSSEPDHYGLRLSEMDVAPDGQENSIALSWMRVYS